MFDATHGEGTGPERAEGRGIADTVLRRLGQIDDLIARFVDRQPKGRGLQILRIMTAELVFLGTPPHAAVDIAVRLAQSAKNTTRLSGLINAVGRRLAEKGAEMAKGQDVASLTMPGWLAKRLSDDWGQDAVRALTEAHLTPAPHDLTLRSEEDLKTLAHELGAEPLSTGSLRLPGRPQISALPGYSEGAWWVQDAAAALPVKLLGDVTGAKVLDLCAAPGGKTMQLAAAGADVLAIELSERRADRLSENLERTSLDAAVTVADMLDWMPSAVPDAIVLDAPCSATGTIRRHPDLQHRGSGKAIDDLAALQARMLDRAFGWLEPGGRLVFCTCSLLKAEGEQQLEAFLSRNENAQVAPASTNRLGVQPDWITQSGALRTRPDYWPMRGGLDGFFAVCLSKR